MFDRFMNDAHKLFNEGKIREAVLFMDSAYAQQASVSPYGLYVLYGFKTEVYYHDRDLVNAAKYIDSALSIMKDEAMQQRHQEGYTHSLLEKGHILLAQGNYDKAHSYYADALQHARAVVSNPHLINEYYYHVGMALYKEAQFEKAAGYFRDGFVAAFTYKDGEKPYMRMQESLDNIGLCYFVLNKQDSAIYYFDSCQSFIDKNERYFTDKKVADDARSVAYENKGMALVNARKFDQAEQNLEKSVAISRLSGSDPVRMRSAKIKLATLYIDAKEYDKSKTLITDILASLDSLPDTYVYMEMQDLMSDYYMNTRQYEKAATAIYYVARYTDSLSKIKLKSKETDVLRDLKEKDQQYHIQLLQKDNHYQSVRSKVIITFAVMAVVILVLIYIYYRRAHKNEQLLAASNKEITAQKAALEKTNKEKDHILGVVAHDLRNPVGSMGFLADMLLDNEDGSFPVEETLGMIKTSSVGALQLINELVDFTGEEQGEIKKEKTDVVALVKETMQMMNYRLNEKKQTIVPALPAVPLIIALHKEKIRRVINNLVGNAVKFTPEAGSIGISVTKEENGVLVAVKDNGIGIPASMIANLFDMNRKNRRAGTSGEKSFGLGLSITRQIVEAHGGKIWVESTEGAGSTFFVQLPA